MADKVIALSEDWKGFLVKYICEEDKIQVIYNAVRIPDPYEKDYSNKKMLFLGRLGQRKGTYDLIEVLPAIFQKFPDAHMYFGGDGEREQAEALCRKKGIADHVTFLGWVRDAEKEKYLKECSVYVLPTYHEGMPMSILEAMAYGMAVVSTYVGGIPHLITDGENGLLCEAGDVDLLRKKIKEFLDNEEVCERIGRSALQTIEKNFDMRLNIKKILEMYEKL